MTAPYDPGSERTLLFARLASLPVEPVGSGGESNGLGAALKVFRHRQMLDLLVRRDLKSRYKDSSLGFVWTLIRPLTQLLIYYVVLGQFLGAARGIPDFAVYIFSGLTIYGLFSEIVQSGVGSIVSNAGLVKKVYLPREVFPLASVGAAIFNFAIQMVVLIAAVLLSGSLRVETDLLYAVPSILLVIVYGTAFALLLSAVNVYLRDTQYLTEVLMMFMMWASPIVYSWSMAKNIIGNGLILDAYTNNPITLAVLGFHKAFWGSGADTEYPDLLLLRMVIAIVVGLVLLAVFHGVFRRLQGNFAQEL